MVAAISQLHYGILGQLSGWTRSVRNDQLVGRSAGKKQNFIYPVSYMKFGAIAAPLGAAKKHALYAHVSFVMNYPNGIMGHSGQACHQKPLH